jgi:hypothetical protein
MIELMAICSVGPKNSFSSRFVGSFGRYFSRFALECVLVHKFGEAGSWRYKGAGLVVPLMSRREDQSHTGKVVVV